MPSANETVAAENAVGEVIESLAALPVTELLRLRGAIDELLAHPRLTPGDVLALARSRESHG